MTDTLSKKLYSGPIFIVGAPRSGTTLLQYRLRNHPRISLPTGESHFFIPLYRNQNIYGDLNQIENVRSVLEAMHRRSKDFLETDLHGIKFDVNEISSKLHAEGRNTLPSIISGIYEMNALGEGKVRWGDKTPYYVLHIPKLLEWFPDAQIIHLIRDGRDVALSLFGRRHDFRVYNIYHAAKYWQQYVERGHELGNRVTKNQYIEVRYEDLLTQPVATMQKLFSFLGEEYYDHLFDTRESSNPGKTPLVHKPIQPDNTGKWRQRLTPGQIRVFEGAAGNTLAKFGYEIHTSTKPLSIIVRTAYRLHNKLIRAYWRRRQEAA